MEYSELKKLTKKQGRTKESQNLLDKMIQKCKREKKTARECFSEINQLIVNPHGMGVC